MAWSDPVRLTKTSADLTPATGARTTRFCRPQAALRQEVLRTVHVRQNVCEAGCSAVRPARLDRSQAKPALRSDQRARRCRVHRIPAL